MAERVTIPEYGCLKIGGDYMGTLAYMSGDARRLYVRDGSDSFELPVGQCVPITKDFAQIINPYPRQISIVIARGLPVQFSQEVGAYTNEQSAKTMSISYVQRDAAATGRKFAVGMMMKRGKGIINAYERTADNFSKIMIFQGARPDFMSFKPAGCMDENINFAFSDGVLDQSFHCVGGTYTDDDVSNWIAAANYQKQPVIQRHASFMQGFSFYLATTDTAVFYVRDADQGCHAMLRMTHLGSDVEEFD
ncbi:hypothetical protein OD754_10740 [Rhodobacter capsulatus]|uniref:hypothetical protein n=1 Tax=Rhodobacter capsulatus TaxID=1061 RepID=UPI002875C8AF|nr:hypothetical protein [Rhodobacter capsulatus]MDS0927300.1 hypothetical protein [Rhodobacter capsulatus]UYE93263.1 hypothetical protein Jorvik_14 [Rhodobacter phage Jorvik]